jgi:hypothetical protein
MSIPVCRRSVLIEFARPRQPEGFADPMIAKPSGPMTRRCPREVMLTVPPACSMAAINSRVSLDRAVR